MSGRPARQYVVHLDIQASGSDPSAAVRDALEQVQSGAPADFDYSVQELAGDAAPGPSITHHRNSSKDSDRDWGNKRHKEPKTHNRYPNEFLG